MLVQVAEGSFQKGKDFLEQGQCKEALAFFEAAVALEQRFGVDRPQARYLSYYGLCLAISKIRIAEAVKACRTATDIERYNPDLHCNLGRVLLAAGRRRQAYAVFRQGLRVEPRHDGLRRELIRMGRRRRPVLPFLSRANRLNVYLGKLRNTA